MLDLTNALFSQKKKVYLSNRLYINEQMIRDTIRHLAAMGIEWFKVYRKTRPQDLEIIIDAAHQHGAKVTGHLCATTYKTAAKLGIDAILRKNGY